MNPDLITTAPKPYVRPTQVIKVRDIQDRILRLSNDISKEKNTKHKARLVDEQAALKLTLRVMNAYTTRGQCVR